MKKKNIILVLTIITLIILLDQLSKFIIFKYIGLYSSKKIINNFFYLTTSLNTGAAYGLFNNKRSLIIITSIFMFIFIIHELIRNKDKYKFIIPYSLLMGGLIGNLIDRIYLGYVRDFISFIIFNHECAIFNFADMFIVIGAVTLCFNYIMEGYCGNNCK